jgi:hypothetical protein
LVPPAGKITSSVRRAATRAAPAVTPRPHRDDPADGLLDLGDGCELDRLEAFEVVHGEAGRWRLEDC